MLLRDVLCACTDLQNDITYRDVNENTRNRFLRAILKNKYIVHDQTEIGESATGIQSGEVDLEIRKDQEMPWIILEALNISGSGQTDIKNWNKHLDKLMVNYNRNGLGTLLLVSYLESSQKRFAAISDAYFEHIQNYAPLKFGVKPERCSYLHMDNVPQHLHITQAEYSCGGYRVAVYHYLVLIQKTKESKQTDLI